MLYDIISVLFLATRFSKTFSILSLFYSFFFMGDNCPQKNVGICAKKFGISLKKGEDFPNFQTTRRNNKDSTKKGERSVFFSFSPPPPSPPSHLLSIIVTIVNKVKHCYFSSEISAGSTTIIIKSNSSSFNSAIETYSPRPVFLTRCP